MSNRNKTLDTQSIVCAIGAVFIICIMIGAWGSGDAYEDSRLVDEMIKGCNQLSLNSADCVNYWRSIFS